MPSRSGLFVAVGVTLLSAASGCGLVFDYSDYTGTGGAGPATTTGDGTTTSANGGAAASSSASGSASSSASSASSSSGGMSCPGGCVATPNPAAKVVYRSTTGTCTAGSAPTDYVECTACSCKPTAGTCTVNAVDVYDDTICSAASAQVSVTSICVQVLQAKQGVQAIVTFDGNGSCVPKATTESASAVTLCEAAANSTVCPSGTVCAPKVLAANHLCRLYPNDVDCPTKVEIKTSVYTGNSGTCSCGCAQACDQGTMTVFAGQTCEVNVSKTIIPLTGQCYASADPFESFSVPSTKQPSSCTVKQAQAGVPPQTLCCDP